MTGYGPLHVFAPAKVKSVVVYGAGNGGQFLALAASYIGYEIAGFIDDDPVFEKNSYFFNEKPVKVVARNDYNSVFNDIPVICEIYNPKTREDILSSFTTLTIAHPKAIIDHTSSIGLGSFIKSGAIIDAFNSIGMGCVIDNGAIITHNTNIGNYCNISAGSVIGSSVNIGNRVIIGLGCTIQSGISIADDVTVVSGSTVLKSIKTKGETFKWKMSS